jgi:murein DD-endopeptidase MepM/ murein hydrolase activator NlpD
VAEKLNNAWKLAFVIILIVSPAARARQDGADDTPVLRMEGSPAESRPKPAGSRTGLRPLAAPKASLVDLAPEPPGGYARIVPPTPRIRTTKPRKGVLPPRSIFAAGSGRTVRPAFLSVPAMNSPFGFRKDPITGRGRMHTGIDLEADLGESVGSALPGTVAFAGVKRGYGNLVVVDHGSGVSTYYAHLSQISGRVGDSVLMGQTIGLAGSTGRSTGPHVHFEVRANGRPLKPSSELSYRRGQIYANGQPVTGPAEDGWGDEPESEPEPPAPVAAGNQDRNPAPAKPAPKPVMIVEGDALRSQ